MTRILSRIASLLLVLPGLGLSACGNNNKANSIALSEAESADQVVNGFVYDEKVETKFDQSAFNNSATKEGYSVVTLYFEGGLAKNCARWDFSLKGEGLTLAKGEKLNTDQQKLLKVGSDGTITGKFETHGTLEGLRVVAQAGTKIRFLGTQDFCLTKDATEFDVKIDVKLTAKPKRLFTGVDAPGQTAVRIRVTDEKEDAAAKGDAE